LVEKIDCKTKTPTLFTIPELTLRQNDTLVLEFDQDIWDLHEAEQMIKGVSKIYPKNNIMVLFKGIKIGVIHNVDN
jgi:NRPS condensation-like uncharacterized protein